MLYLTPLEVGPDDKLVSQVLSEFYYDSEENQIIFKVRDDQFFSDGFKIEPNDIAYSIIRMLKKRPKFPVIKNIQGKEEWLSEGGKLDTPPLGLHVNGNNITIQLNQKEHNPLYRFALEIFSIIPRMCIDPKTSDLICRDVPTSGHYRLAKQSENETIFIKRNSDKIYGLNAPQKVIFRYLSNPKFEVGFSVGENQIIAINEAKLSLNELTYLDNNFSLAKQPSSRFSIFLVNKKSRKLNNKKLRVWLVKNFRRAYADISNTQVETSIFTKILPGYLSDSELVGELDNIESPTVDELKALENLVWFENPAHEQRLLRLPLQKVFEEASKVA